MMLLTGGRWIPSGFARSARTLRAAGASVPLRGLGSLASFSRPPAPGLPVDTAEIDVLHVGLDTLEPEGVIQWAADSGNVAMMSSFGIQAAVLLHMATRVKPDIPVLMVDTGYLFPETYTYAEELKDALDLNLTVVSPAMSSARMEATYGKLWESEVDDDHKTYGAITKTEPMSRALASLEIRPDFILSGLRAGQTETRKNMKRITAQADGTFKVLPMLRMSDDDVDRYFEQHNLPQHPLLRKGFVTVGDWHSSRPLQEGETKADARNTRFGGRFQECGLHVQPDESSVPEIKVTASTPSEAPAKKSTESILSATTRTETSCYVSHLVKKRMDDGSMCKKCNDVTRRLKADGLESLIGGISIADTKEPKSDGITLAEHFSQDKAPFFLVKDECALDASWTPITVYGEWKRLMKKQQQMQQRA